MDRGTTDERIVALCEQIKAKPVKLFCTRVLAHGSITTDEIEAMGYSAARVARAVRDHGLPLETINLANSKTGEASLAYCFGDPSEINYGLVRRRRVFSRAIRKGLIDPYGATGGSAGKFVEAGPKQSTSKASGTDVVAANSLENGEMGEVRALPMQSRELFGQRLRHIRQMRGLTLEEVGRSIGVSRACVCQWEGGKSHPKPSFLPGLARSLGTSVSYLIAGEEEQIRAVGALPSDVIYRARREIAAVLGLEVSKVRIEIDFADRLSSAVPKLDQS